jgi:hypothetical protein
MPVKSSAAVKPDSSPGADLSDGDLVARFGSFLLTSVEPFEPPYIRTLDAIASSLEADPRVSSVQSPGEIDEGWCIERRVFPSPADGESLVSGGDALQALQFSEALLLSIRQPPHPEDDEKPTKYSVVWDGFLAVVTWRTQSARPVGLFEGHVVREILGEALERLGLCLYLQGCNPDCTHKFAHTSIRFVPDPDDPEDIQYVEAENWAEVEARAPIMDDDELAGFFFSDLLLAMRSFTVLKNVGQRILELEVDSRAKLSELMQFNFERARLPTLPISERVKARRTQRKWLHKSRFLIARIWLTLSNIEYLRREWSALRFDFEGSSGENGKRKLFERDYADEVDRVQSLDLDLVRSGVQEMAERLDSRALLRVTAVAAVAGAIAGGLIAGLVGSSF